MDGSSWIVPFKISARKLIRDLISSIDLSLFLPAFSTYFTRIPCIKSGKGNANSFRPKPANRTTTFQPGGAN